MSKLCKLCDRQAKLQRSHIVPEFFYAYDERHRLLSIDGKRERPRLEQKGTRVPLLCFDCEQYLNDHFEKPMRRMWVEKQALPTPLLGDAVVVSGLDYAPFKLFHLSVLWRGLVSKQQDEINAAGEHPNTVRSMLLDRRPGTPLEYPIVMAPLRLANTVEPAAGTVMVPQWSEMSDQVVYCSVFGGCQWFYVLSTTGIPNREVQNWALNEDGRLVGTVRTLRDVEEIDALMSRYESNAREKNWPDPWRTKRGG